MENNIILPAANSVYVKNVVAKLEKLVSETKESKEKSEARLVRVLTRLCTTYPDIAELPAPLFDAIRKSCTVLSAIGYKVEFNSAVAGFQISSITKK